MCCFSPWSLEETIVRKTVPSVFQSKKMNFKPCLLNKENSVWISQISFFLSFFPPIFKPFLCRSEVGAHELFKKARNKTEIQVLFRVRPSCLWWVTWHTGFWQPLLSAGSSADFWERKELWKQKVCLSGIDPSHWSNRLNNIPWKHLIIVLCAFNHQDGASLL